MQRLSRLIALGVMVLFCNLACDNIRSENIDKQDRQDSQESVETHNLPKGLKVANTEEQPIKVVPPLTEEVYAMQYWEEENKPGDPNIQDALNELHSRDRARTSNPQKNNDFGNYKYLHELTTSEKDQYSLAFTDSPDQLYSAGAGNRITVWRTIDWKVAYYADLPYNNGIRQIDTLPEGHVLIGWLYEGKASNISNAQVFDKNTPLKVKSVYKNSSQEYPGYIWNQQNWVSLYDLSKPDVREITNLIFPSKVLGFSLSKNKNFLNILTATHLYRLTTEDNGKSWAYTIAYSHPFGKVIAYSIQSGQQEYSDIYTAYSNDKYNNKISLLKNNEVIAHIENLQGDILLLEIMDNQRYVLVGTKYKLELYKINSSKYRHTRIPILSPIASLSLTDVPYGFFESADRLIALPDKKSIVAINYNYAIFIEVKVSPAQLRVLPAHQGIAHSDHIYDVAVSTNRFFFFALGRDNKVSVWRVPFQLGGPSDDQYSNKPPDPRADIESQIDELIFLRKDLVLKRLEVGKYRTLYREEIVALEDEAKRIATEKRVDNFSGAMNVPRINHILHLLSKNNAYNDALVQLDEELQTGIDEMRYLISDLVADKRFIEVAGADKFTAIAKKVASVKDRYLPKAGKLVLPEPNNFPSEEEVWNDIMSEG